MPYITWRYSASTDFSFRVWGKLFIITNENIQFGCYLDAFNWVKATPSCQNWQDWTLLKVIFDGCSVNLVIAVIWHKLDAVIHLSLMRTSRHNSVRARLCSTAVPHIWTLGWRQITWGVNVRCRLLSWQQLCVPPFLCWAVSWYPTWGQQKKCKLLFWATLHTLVVLHPSMQGL